MSDVFVSYSRRDTGYVASLAAELRARDKEVWVDTEGLADAEVFPAALRAAIEQADAFVYVISPEAASSRYCTTEVDHAHGLGKRIVPVLLRPVSDDELPPEIRDRNWIPADAADALPRLLTAIDTDREHVRAHTRWTGRAVEWEQSGREGSLLPRGSELSAGEAWLAACDPGADPAPTRSQQELLLAARRAATRRQRRLLGGAVGALLISLGLLVFALISRHAVAEQRTIARAQAFAARSDAALTLSPLAALHLARSAVQTRADPVTLRALKQADDTQSLIAAPASVKAVAGCQDPKPAYRPASDELALGSCDGTVHIVDARTGEPIRTMHVGGDASTIAYRPDGEELAVLNRTEVRLVDPASGATRVRILLPPGPAAVPVPSTSTLAYSPDGRNLAAVTAGRTAVLINTRARTVRTLTIRRGGFGGAAFVRPGGELVVSARSSGLVVFDAHSGREVRRISMHGGQQAGPIAVGPGGDQVAVGVGASGNRTGYVRVVRGTILAA